MHYVMSDIHNDYYSLNKMLEIINFGENDRLFLLGDLFDRGNYNPSPVDVYFTILKLEDQCTIILGNHDQELADYIQQYYSLPKRKRKKLPPYPYNSFELLRQRLTDVDIQNLAKIILAWPDSFEIEIEGVKYFMSHEDRGEKTGYISIFGHERRTTGIWKNSEETLIGVDCGCGYGDGVLGCLRLEDKKEIYLECYNHKVQIPTVFLGVCAI